MGQRVTLEQAARLCGRAEKTLRAWLAEEPPPLSVVYGHWRGGTRGKGGKVTKGRTRLLDVAELEALNAARGGTWHAEHLPPPDVDALAEEVAALRARIAALESARRAVYAPVTRSGANLAALANTLPGMPLDASRPSGASQTRTQPPQRREGSPPSSSHPNPLPDGWVPLSTWARRHGLNEQSVRRQCTEGRILMPSPERAPDSAPWGSWSATQHKWYDVATAYRADQLAEAVRVAQLIWGPAGGKTRWHPCEDSACPCPKPSASA